MLTFLESHFYEEQNVTRPKSRFVAMNNAVHFFFFYSNCYYQKKKKKVYSIFVGIFCSALELNNFFYHKTC